MPDLTVIAGAIASMKTAGDIAKGLIGIRDEAKIRERVIELQQVILSAQQSAIAAQSGEFELMEQIRNLEQKLVELQDWEREKKRYRLRDFGGGTFARELKDEEVTADEPKHLICANCFDQRRKSTLQFQGHDINKRILQFCPGCKTQFALGIPEKPPTPRVIKPWTG